jgi:hypothetical protein
MPVDLAGHLERLTRRVEDQQFPRAAERMAETLSDGARSAMGGDLTFSGGAGTVRIEGEAERGRVVVTVSGAYALADKGRRSAVSAKATGRGLRTPFGPRRSVKGSTWGGFGITSRYGRQALRAGVDGVVDEVEWGR